MTKPSANSLESKLNALLERAANIDAEMEGHKETCKQACKVPKEDLKELKGEAIDAGFHKDVWADALRKQRDEFKRAKARRKFDSDAREQWDRIFGEAEAINASRRRPTQDGTRPAA